MKNSILFLTRLYYPHIGGVERHIDGLCKVLVKRGYKISILTEQYDTSLSLDEEYMSTHITRIPVAGISESKKKWVIWRWIRAHEKWLDDMSIIHVHDVFFWLYWYKFSHPKRKIFLTNHGWEEVYPLPRKAILEHRLNTFLAAGNINIGDYIVKWYGTPADFVSYGAA